jgi:exonuclease III
MAHTSLSFVSYNMRGFNTGVGMTRDLSLEYSVIAVQEHWLRKDNMDRLGLINTDFCFYGISSMNNAVSTGFLKGRPFGGTAFLWNSKLNNSVKVLDADPEGRCIAISISLGDRNLVVFNVYLPCHDSSAQYESDIINYVGFIDSVLNSNSHTDVMIMGDTNFQCVSGNNGYRRFLPLLHDRNLVCCDSLMGGVSTYVNSALGHESCVDHVFVSSALFNDIVCAKVVDCGHNASDHRPVVVELGQSVIGTVGGKQAQKSGRVKVYRFRWDKANLAAYYAASYDYLSSIPLVSQNVLGKCKSEIAQLIEMQYGCIVRGLQEAALLTVPRLPVNSLHHFWNDELDDLKAKSVFWHSIWKDNGCPRSGSVQIIKCQAALLYKQAIRHAMKTFDSQFDEDILLKTLA